MPPVLRPLSIGEILDAGFTLYRRHFGRLLTVMLVTTTLPTIALLAVNWWVGILTSMLGQLAAQIGIIWIVAEVVLGQTPRPHGVPGVILRAFIPVLGVQVVVMLMIALGLIALVVPGILLTIMTFCVVQVTVVEGDVGVSLSRSWHLARGSMGRVAVVILFVSLLNLVVNGVLQLGMNDWDVTQLFDTSMESPDLGEFSLSMLVGAVVGPYGFVVMTLLYFDERVRKDGLDVELVAEAAGS